MKTGSLTPFYIDEKLLDLLVDSAIAATLHAVVKDYMKLYLNPFFLFWIVIGLESSSGQALSDQNGESSQGNSRNFSYSATIFYLYIGWKNSVNGNS